MNHAYEQLEADLKEVLAAMISFNTSEVAEVEQFLCAGEYGLALETLCEIANEEGKPVPAEARPKIRKLAEQMEIDPIWWNKLVQEK